MQKTIGSNENHIGEFWTFEEAVRQAEHFSIESGRLFMVNMYKAPDGTNSFNAENFKGQLRISSMMYYRVYPTIVAFYDGRKVLDEPKNFMSKDFIQIYRREVHLCNYFGM